MNTLKLHNNNLTFNFHAERWFYFFIFIHLICWTVVPASMRLNLPLDSIEGTIWGQHLQWGYDRDPFLNGWLTALATYFDGQTGWMVYLFSQISVVLCFWAVWQLANKMLSPIYALISVMMLEGIQYYHIHAIDFNDNTLELSLWALTTYFFYQALHSKTRKLHYINWILTGAFAGLGMMAKYYTASLLLTMTLLLFFNAHHRKQWSTLPPYLGLVTCFIIVLPHLIWLFFHDFITISYVFQRIDSAPNWFNHIFFPTQFAWQQIEAFLPALSLFLLLLIGKKPVLTEKKIKLTFQDQEFLFFLGFGPFLLTVLLAFVAGIKLRAGWGMPLLSLWGILTVIMIQPQITQAKLYRFITFLFVLMFGMLCSYAFSLIHSKQQSSANYPGHEIAQIITSAWHNVYHTKLAYVAGPRWVNGNVSFYSPDHPSVFIEWNEQRAPWIDRDDMEQKGAMFIWSISDNETIPPFVSKRYPQLLKTDVIDFEWKRDKQHLSHIKIGVAILPPNSCKVFDKKY